MADEASTAHQQGAPIALTADTQAMPLVATPPAANPARGEQTPNQPAVPSWDEALASYQRHLDTLATLIASGQAEALPEWVPPTGLGPMPAALVGMATTLDAQAEELMRTLTITMAKTRMEIESMARSNRPTPRAQINTTMLDEKA